MKFHIFKRDQTITTKLRELQAERWHIVGVETLHLDELVSGEEP
jgi:hypothetical protein